MPTLGVVEETLPRALGDLLSSIKMWPCGPLLQGGSSIARSGQPALPLPPLRAHRVPGSSWLDRPRLRLCCRSGDFLRQGSPGGAAGNCSQPLSWSNTQGESFRFKNALGVPPWSQKCTGFVATPSHFLWSDGNPLLQARCPAVRGHSLFIKRQSQHSSWSHSKPPLWRQLARRVSFSDELGTEAKWVGRLE